MISITSLILLSLLSLCLDALGHCGAWYRERLTPMTLMVFILILSMAIMPILTEL